MPFLTWFNYYGPHYDRPFFGFFWLLSMFLVWSFIWKGWALWRSSRNNQLGWFIALLIINAAGLLEIIYLAFFQKKTVIVKPAPARRTKKSSKWYNPG